MTIEADRLESVNLMVDTYSRVNDGVMHVRILDQNDVVLSDTQVQLSNLASGTYNTIMLEEPIDHMRGNALTLQLTTEGCMPGNAITLYYGNSVTAGRFDIVKQIQDDEFFQNLDKEMADYYGEYEKRHQVNVISNTQLPNQVIKIELNPDGTVKKVSREFKE